MEAQSGTEADSRPRSHIRDPGLPVSYDELLEYIGSSFMADKPRLSPWHLYSLALPSQGLTNCMDADSLRTSNLPAPGEIHRCVMVHHLPPQTLLKPLEGRGCQPESQTQKELPVK